MDLKDQLYIIRNRLFEKRNIILIIVMTIILLILFTCLTIIQFSIENKNEILNSENTRTYKIYPEARIDEAEIDYVGFTEEQINTIRKINHVELVMSEKYQFEKMFEVPFFDKGNEKGVLSIKALLKDDDIKIKKGTNIKNKYELVCSNTFYPHEYDERIYGNLFLPNNTVLNKSVTITSSNEDLKEKGISLKIVGTYENKFMEASNTCYTNIETYDEIVSKYNGYTESYDELGNLIYRENKEYRNYFIRIDSKENIDMILSSLNNMNIKYDKTFYQDSTFLSMLLSIPLFISIVIILLTLSILNNFISKKINNRIHNIGILKSLGYDEKAIKSLNANENLFLIFISTIISLLIYFISLHYLKYTLLAEVTYTNCILNIPYILIAISFIVYCIIITIIVKSKLKKIFSLSIQKLLEK